MSRVSNVMICGLDCEEHIGEINEWLSKWNEDIKDVSGMAGGGKHLEVSVLLGAFNHFPCGKFIDFLKTIQWEWRTEVFIKEEDDDGFCQTILSDGWRHTEPPERWHLYYPKG